MWPLRSNGVKRSFGARITLLMITVCLLQGFSPRIYNSQVSRDLNSHFLYSFTRKYYHHFEVFISSMTPKYYHYCISLKSRQIVAQSPDQGHITSLLTKNHNFRLNIIRWHHRGGLRIQSTQTLISAKWVPVSRVAISTKDFLNHPTIIRLSRISLNSHRNGWFIVYKL